MGSYYAQRQGYDEDICDAIKNHYMPVTDETQKKYSLFASQLPIKLIL